MIAPFERSNFPRFCFQHPLAVPLLDDTDVYNWRDLSMPGDASRHGSFLDGHFVDKDKGGRVGWEEQRMPIIVNSADLNTAEDRD